MAESTSGILIPVRLRSKNDTIQYPRELTELNGKLYFNGNVLNETTTIKDSDGTIIGSTPEITIPEASNSAFGFVKIASDTNIPKASTASGSAGTSTVVARADHSHPAQTNVANANKATNDANGQEIASTYIKSLTVSGTTITITKGDNSKDTITTQDTTYPNATESKSGLISPEDKTKLDSIENNAQENVIESINSSNLTVTTDSAAKSVTINLEWGEF